MVKEHEILKKIGQIASKHLKMYSALKLLKKHKALKPWKLSLFIFQFGKIFKV